MGFGPCRFFQSPGKLQVTRFGIKSIRRLVLFLCKLGRRLWMELGHMALEWGSPCASGVLLNPDGLWAQFTIYPYPAQSEPHLFCQTLRLQPRGIHLVPMGGFSTGMNSAVLPHSPLTCPPLYPCLPLLETPSPPAWGCFLPSSGDGVCSQHSEVLSHHPLPSC